MSEVTGTLGSESIRLRGMALEETQRELLLTLQKIAKIDSKSVGGFFGAIGDASKDTSGKLGVLGGAVSKFSGVVGVITGAGKVLGSILTDLTGGFEGVSQQIRTSSGAIRDQTNNLRILGSRTTGATSAIYKFAAEGIGQLEEQFDVYKRLSNIGGVVAGDFDNLRINASTLGVTMQEYAGLMEENFLNLRLNGTSAKNGMRDLRLSAQSMRDSGEAFNDQFMRLGIGANDYGKVILQNSMLFGGLTKAQQTYGSMFNDKMLQTTKTVTQLGDAFGFNREVIMKAANEALQDARNRTIFNNIREEGKQQMLSLMTGMFGGDAQKGMRATIAAYTGRFDEQSAVLAGMAPDLMQKMKALSAAVAKGVPVMDAIKQVDLGPTFARIESQSNDLAQGFLDNAGAPGIAANALLTLQQMFGDMPAVQKRLEDSTKSLTDTQGKNLDALGTFQRENIRIAVSMGEANRVLNTFGLGVALSSQIITAAVGELAKGLGVAGDKALLESNVDAVTRLKELNLSATKEIREFSKTSSEGIDKLIDRAVNKFNELTSGTNTQSGNQNQSRNGAQTQGTAQPPNTGNAQQTSAQTTPAANASTPVRQSLGPAANALLGAIEGVQRTNSTLPDNEKLRGGVKFDYKINKGEEVSKQVDQIKTLMAQANLKEGTDFKLSSQYDGTSGKVGVEFMSTEAADKFAQVASKIKNPPPPPAPNAAAPRPETSAVVQPRAAGPSSTTTETQAQVSTSTQVASQNQLNTNGTQVATLGTESDILNGLLQNNNENTTRVINKLESMTASIMMSIPQG
jgi:hypothetical protein